METFGDDFPRTCLENLVSQHELKLPASKLAALCALYRSVQDPERVRATPSRSLGCKGLAAAATSNSRAGCAHMPLGRTPSALCGGAGAVNH
jgi:hypothetical protein